MSTFAEIQAAAEALPLNQQEELYRLLRARLYPATPQLRKARVVRRGNDTLLEAASDAPPMTAENVKQMVEDWP